LKESSEERQEKKEKKAKKSSSKKHKISTRVVITEQDKDSVIAKSEIPMRI